MVLMTWPPSGVTLYNHNECALSQVNIHLEMILDVAWPQSANKLLKKGDLEEK